MKKRIILAMMAILVFASSQGRAGIELDADARARIEAILSQPASVYRVDGEAGKMILMRIDEWAGGQIDMSKAARKMGEGGKNEYFVFDLEKNRAISSSGERIEGVRQEHPFEVAYVKSPDGRFFVKGLDVPAIKKLKDGELERIGREFLKKTGFCRQTESDKIGRSETVSTLRQKILQEGEEGRKQVLSQEVIFRRHFMGMEVFNSKLAVGVHPASKEILSFRTSRWAPADEKSGERMDYEELDSVLRRITGRFEKSPYEYEVTEIRPGMYQAGGRIFPVMRLEARPRPVEGGPALPDRILIVGLVKGLDTGEEEKSSIRRPEKASQK